MSERYRFPGQALVRCPVPPDPQPSAESLAVMAVPGIDLCFYPDHMVREPSLPETPDVIGQWSARNAVDGGAWGYRGFAGEPAAIIQPEAIFNGHKALTFPSGTGNIRFDMGTATDSFTVIIAAMRSSAMVAVGDLFGFASSSVSSSQKGVYYWNPTSGGRMLFVDNKPIESSTGNNETAEPAADRADIYTIAYDHASRKSYQQINHGTIIEYTHVDTAPVITNIDRLIIGGGAPEASQSWRGKIALAVKSRLPLFDGGQMQEAHHAFVANRIAAYNIT